MSSIMVLDGLPVVKCEGLLEEAQKTSSALPFDKSLTVSRFAVLNHGYTEVKCKGVSH